MTFPYGTDVVVHYGTVKVNAVAIVSLYELQTPLVEVTRPLVSNLYVGDYVHCQLCCSIAIRAQVKHRGVQIVVFDWPRRGRVTQNASNLGWSKMETVAFRVAVFAENRLRPIAGTTRILIRTR